MIEHVMSAVSFALKKRDGEIPAGQPDWELIIIDAMVDAKHNMIPGSGSGQVTRILLDEASVAVLHEQSQDASPVVRPLPSMVIPRGGPRKH